MSFFNQGRGTFDHVWLAQVTGSTSVTLLPVEDCDHECEKFDFTLNQGEVCKYDTLDIVLSFVAEDI